MASHESTYNPKSGVEKWLDERLPIIRWGKTHLMDYPTPKNLNYWWTFGAILAFMLVRADRHRHRARDALHARMSSMAFDSVEHIRRDVNCGRIIQATHAVGASMFFAALYIHIFRGLYFGSYKAPREVLWILGVLIFVLMMATAFMGYVLPWGQMSFWAATVITNIFAAIPIVGDPILQLLRGGFAVDNATLNRFFSLHYLLPFIIAAVVVLHIWALHVPGNNNPDRGRGEGQARYRGVPPVLHDEGPLRDRGVLHPVRVVRVLRCPTSLGHPDNYIMANSQVTPAHIVPEWYFLPFYAILRAIDFNILFIDSRLGGVIAFGGSILILFFLPWLDRSPVRSGTFRPLFQPFYWLFVVNFVALMYLGSAPAEGIYVVLAKVCTAYYFLYFIVILPLLSRFETPRPLPVSISEAVLAKPH